ncbi:MAG: ISNCY family transposase [Alicyclobacillaceae bacterium]|nr:ISNCY family transposase [Alicyclobacillaceae bacterium]
MTNRELKRALVLERLVKKDISLTEAAHLLRLSTRQILRLKARYLQHGSEGLIHRNRGRKPAHALPQNLKDHILALFQSPRYQGANDCHFADLLREHEQISISPSTVRRIRIQAGLSSRRRRRPPKSHRPRPRKPQAGLLWQIDASPFDWLEDRGPRLSLLAAIDDATGQVVGAVFRPQEDLAGYFEVMRQGILAHGVPVALYSDRHTIFCSPREPLTIEQQLAGQQQPLSQFGQALAELGITHYKARTPQAKGRIERLWQTLQSRLVIELRLRNVCSLEEANAVLPELIARHNARFAVRPDQAQSAYRPLPRPLDLRYVLCFRDDRTVGTGQTISYQGTLYTLAVPRSVQAPPPKTRVQVRQTLEGEIVACYQGALIPLRPANLSSPAASPPVQKKTAGPRPPHRPAADHPWRRAAVFSKNRR